VTGASEKQPLRRCGRTHAHDHPWRGKVFGTCSRVPSSRQLTPTPGSRRPDMVNISKRPAEPADRADREDQGRRRGLREEGPKSCGGARPGAECTSGELEAQAGVGAAAASKAGPFRPSPRATVRPRRRPAAPSRTTRPTSHSRRQELWHRSSPARRSWAMEAVYSPPRTKSMPRGQFATAGHTAPFRRCADLSELTRNCH
jgi:hypothetical protein